MNTGITATIRAWLRRSTLVILTLVPTAPPLHGQPPGATAAPPAVLQSATVAGNSDVVTIELRAAGPLPAPKIGTATNPARIFLDFAAVRLASPSLRTQGAGDVVRVRAALNTAQPPLTRVVVELTRETAFDVDISRRQRGLVRIVVSGALPAALPSPIEALEQPPRPAAQPATAPSAPPALPAPAATSDVQPSTTASTRPAATPAATGLAASSEAAIAAPSSTPATLPAAAAATPAPAPAAITPASPPAPANRTPTTPPAAGIEPEARTDGVPAPKPSITRPPGWTPLPSADARKYRTTAVEPIRRLQAIRPLVGSIDARAAVGATALADGTRELAAIRQKFESVQPPRSVKPVHDMLVRACGLAEQAIAIRTSPSGATAEWNAASAAAGALMLIDRALADLDMPAMEASR